MTYSPLALLARGEARFTGKANGDVTLAMPGRTRS